MHGHVAHVDATIEFYLVPEVSIALVVLLGSYLYAVSPLNPVRPAAVGRWRIAAFTTGALMIFAAVHPPIETLAETRFSVHMVQHTLLYLVGAPLVLLGLPGWLVEPVFKPRWLRGAARLLTSLRVAFVVGVGGFWVWHLPSVYELTLRDEAVHHFEHLTLIAVSLVMWWPVFSPSRAVPQARRSLQMLYLLLLTVPGGYLSALLVFAREPIYPSYEILARAGGFDAVLDQRIGGLIMKLGGTLVLWLVLTIYFLRWMQGAPSDVPVGSRLRR